MDVREVQKSTVSKLKLIAQAAVEADCNRDAGMSFKELPVKSISTFRSKIIRDRDVLDIATQLFCVKNGLPWKSNYQLKSICKTPRQLNFLANEVLHYVKHSCKSIKRDAAQMEFEL